MSPAFHQLRLSRPAGTQADIAIGNQAPMPSPCPCPCILAGEAELMTLTCQIDTRDGTRLPFDWFCNEVSN
ncbi:hypothetical protein C0Q70_06089 [Pomacea canaliculata]|uniref:Uncharacterized protein n=1 Tax=Pomacea canaliculata TaxID=400727 RepID=A0A2T7PN14_POMCA|nr:hypothetical protein C0Q70_06089 [Pomacea canaliculata]